MASQPIIQSSSIELGTQIIPRNPMWARGLEPPAIQQARRCAAGMERHTGAAPKAKVNIQNAAFPSWHSPPVRGCFLSKAEL